MPQRRRQSGVAIITAMLVMTIATLIAVELAWHTNLELRRTTGMLSRDQARLVALGAESWVLNILRDDRAEDGEAGTDTLEETWAMDMPPLPVDNGSVDGAISDLTGRFNLNNVIDASGARDDIAYQQLRRLLAIVQLDAGLADAIVDWIDPDQQPELQGAEDDRYTTRDPPYRAANFWFTSTSELLAVEGFDLAKFRLIEPHVAALPVRGDGQAQPINVNTATAPVLQSLWDNIQPSDAEAWVSARPYETVDQFRERAGELIDQAMYPYLDVASDYFRLNVIASIGTARLSMYSLIERTGEVATVRLRSFDAE